MTLKQLKTKLERITHYRFRLDKPDLGRDRLSLLGLPPHSSIQIFTYGKLYRVSGLCNTPQWYSCDVWCKTFSEVIKQVKIQVANKIYGYQTDDFAVDCKNDNCF